MRHQILILNRRRKRAPNLRTSDRIIAGLCTLLMRGGRAAVSLVNLTVHWIPECGGNVAGRVVDMLDKQTRGAILRLRTEGHSLRRISRLLSLSRDSVMKIVRIGSDEPPIIHRQGKLDAHRERIAQMLAEFDGNVVKAHRALAEAGMAVRYSTLTAF